MAVPEEPAVVVEAQTKTNPESLVEQLPVVETPTSPSAGFALSRFEFEAGKGNEGTKILMVEWDTSAATVAKNASGAEQENKDTNNVAADTDDSDWEVSWEGKTTVLPIRDTEANADSSTRRVYFLLPPGASIPPLVSISQKKRGGTAKGAQCDHRPALRTKPMPAIFPKELAGGNEAASGKRGVLHTIWAKKRLAELQAEIANEMKDNVESVGLEMALQERQWIVDHFGLTADGRDGIPQPTRLHIPQGPAQQGPASPRSPIGGRLGEKLRGLKLATSPTELAIAAQVAKSAVPYKPAQQQQQPLLQTQTQPLTTSLSLNTSAKAVSSFATFPVRPIAPIGGGVASLDAIVEGTAPPPLTAADVEEDLFALPMSPRSPEMKKSPFSFL